MKIRLKQDKESIFKLLETSNIKRKLKILDRLNGVNEKDSITVLLRVLEDSSWAMREKAAYKLAMYGTKVVLRLKNILRKGYWYTRASACITLGEIGDLRALPSIINVLLVDDNPTVIKESSAALVKLARKDPVDFSNRLKEMSLDETKLLKILIKLETSDTEAYVTIKEAIEHE
jgi:HEAT repeat protein